MATTLHSFADIFNAKFENEGESVTLQKIVIPIIQRDYAQGRKGPEVERVRTRFLNSLYEAVTDKPVTLDFVYGDIDKSGIMTPLDGQQRLTTLFLLHWYAAKKENIQTEDYSFLKRFSYETRYSARDFCEKLIDFTPSFDTELSKELADQPWFPLDWEKDPTINSMLVMLDSIQQVFSSVPDLWGKLNSNAITFYFLPIKDMGLTDELYIKMNSRGKPLTQFEHFKAELEHSLKEIDNSVQNRIIRKIDKDWTDMLWRYRGSDNITDDEFLRYFRFVCDIICYRNGGAPKGKSEDEFDLLKKYFSADNEDVNGNISTLEEFFDCWCVLAENDPDEFLKKYISYDHEPGKIRIDKRYKINIFEDCLRTYGEVSANNRNRLFPLNRIVLLYAIVIYLINRNKISSKQFSRRLRIINNLIQNSPDEISDSEFRTGGNRMPAILRQVDSIILNGVITDNELNFNQAQINEEIEKQVWSEENPDYAESMFELEDDTLLYGQIGIIGLEKPEYFKKFLSLLSCDRDATDCALLTIQPYFQKNARGWRYQLGSKIDKSWTELFHRGAAQGFDNTSEAVKKLISECEDITDEALLKMASDYLIRCEEDEKYDWRYYYIKYKSFRPGRYGKYCWNDYKNKPYEFLVMWAETFLSSNSRQPFLYEIDSKAIDKDNCGQNLLAGNKIVECLNNAYVVKDAVTKEEIKRIDIPQDESGIDSVDRIIFGKDVLEDYLVVPELQLSIKEASIES